jgi:hypothetical protein
MAVDVSEMVAKFMESHDDTDMVPKLQYSKSFHGEVLCATKDDTSVDIICERFSCTLLWKSRI